MEGHSYSGSMVKVRGEGCQSGGGSRGQTSWLAVTIVTCTHNAMTSVSCGAPIDVVDVDP